MDDVNEQSNISGDQKRQLSSSGVCAPVAAREFLGHNKKGVSAAVRSTGCGEPREGSTDVLFVRRFVAEWDYSVWAMWLRAHGREVVPEWALPEIGFVAASGSGECAGFMGGASRPVAMAFGYRDGRCGLVTWLTAAPGCSPRRALVACALVWGAVERELEGRGARLMISPTERPSLVRFMRRRGWRVAHGANVLLWKNVDEGGGVL